MDSLWIINMVNKLKAPKVIFCLLLTEKQSKIMDNGKKARKANSHVV